MGPLCIYHANCDDGFGAAWAVFHAHKSRKDVLVEFHAASYNDAPPHVTGREVIIVDFSYKRPVLEAMAKTAKSILILDHHESAERELEGYPEPPAPWEVQEHGTAPTDIGKHGWLPDAGIYARFDMDVSGAMLAWLHFNASPPPMLIRYIQDRDLWRKKFPGCDAVKFALQTYPYNFEVWDRLMERDINELIAEGEPVLRFYRRRLKEVKAGAFRGEIDGHDVPVCNAPYFMASDLAGELAEGEPFAASYIVSGDGAGFSLRSRGGGLNVSEIAEKFGGGGHAKAAGFFLAKNRDDVSDQMVLNPEDWKPDDAG